jgi:hypothetical protein
MKAPLNIDVPYLVGEWLPKNYPNNSPFQGGYWDDYMGLPHWALCKVSQLGPGWKGREGELEELGQAAGSRTGRGALVFWL